jgi:hypothetical protein
VDLWEGIASDSNSKDFIAKKSFAKAKIKSKAQWKRKWSKGPHLKPPRRKSHQLSDGESDDETNEEEESIDKVPLSASLPAKLKVIFLSLRRVHLSLSLYFSISLLLQRIHIALSFCLLLLLIVLWNFVLIYYKVVRIDARTPC